MDITRIDLMIQNGEFFSHPVLIEAIEHTSWRWPSTSSVSCPTGESIRSRLVYALLRMAKQNGLERVFVHAFMDGREHALADNCAGYLEQLQQKMREYWLRQDRRVNRRYYAMDRDRRRRYRKAYNAMVQPPKVRVVSIPILCRG